MTGDVHADVIVVGGGPAGAVAAAGLARRGHTVLLIARPRAAHRRLAESLPPSTRKLFEATGLLAGIERAGFFPNGGNTVWWGGAPERSERFSGEPGVQADAAQLEQVACDVAAEAGVHILSAGVSAAREGADGWRVEAGGVAAVAAWLIDASGRAGIIARRGMRARGGRPRTFALVGRVRTGPVRHPEEATHTLVESYRDGWAWSVPLSATLRCVTAMVDPDVTALDRSGDLESAWRAELRKTAHVVARLGEMRPDGRVWACSASTYHATTYAQRGLLLAGDAGSFIDPLSSFGVKKALASGWLAGIVVHSALSDPPITEPALALFERREREMFDRYDALTANYCADAAEHHGHAFWTRRARRVEDAAARGRGAALDALRARDTLALSPGASVRRVQAAVIRGDRIVLADAVATSEEPEGATHVEGVDLLRLIARAPLHTDVPALHADVAPHVPLPAFVAALASALAHGFLDHRT